MLVVVLLHSVLPILPSDRYVKPAYSCSHSSSTPKKFTQQTSFLPKKHASIILFYPTNYFGAAILPILPSGRDSEFIGFNSQSKW